MFSGNYKFDLITDERNLLIPRTCENDLLQPGTSFSSINSQSPIYSTFANHSSSSTDSTSPESHLDLFSPFPRLQSRQNDELTPESPVQSNSNPFTTRRQRAIVGRKILYSSDHSKPLEVNKAECDLSQTNTWIDELLHDLPDRSEEKKITRNYELFPKEKSYGSQMSIQQTIPSRSPTFCTSPGLSSFSSHSPTLPPSFIQRYTTPTLVSSFSTSSFSTSSFSTSSFSPPSILGASTSNLDEIAPIKICSFCRKNGEAPRVYMKHSLKEKVGSQSIVTCPILRCHTCPECGANGDFAHTITYCPLVRNINQGKRPQSTTITLKSTRVKSNGKRRY